MDNCFPLFLIPFIPLLGAAFNLLFGKQAKKKIITIINYNTIAIATLIATKTI